MSQSRYTRGVPLSTGKLYWTTVGYFEDAQKTDTSNKRYQLEKIVELTGEEDANYVEAGRIYYDTLAREYVVLYYPAKDDNKNGFEGTPFLNEVDQKMKGAVNEAIGDNQYRQYFLVAELNDIAGFVSVNHYTVATVTASQAGIVDSMSLVRALAYPDKKIRDFLAQQREAVTVSDTKARGWQDAQNNWKCGHYAFAEIVYQEKAKLNLNEKHVDIFEANKKNKESVEDAVVAKHKILRDALVLPDEIRQRMERKKGDHADIDLMSDTFDKLFDETASVSDAGSDEGQQEQPELKVVIRSKSKEKESFWQRHPILKAMAIGAAITLGLAAVVGIGIVTGGFGVPALAGVAGVASGFLTGLAATATAWFAGLGASSAVATGLTVAAGSIGGVIAGMLPGALAGVIFGGVKHYKEEKAIALARNSQIIQSTHAKVLIKLGELEQAVIDTLKNESDESKELYGFLKNEYQNNDARIIKDLYLFYKDPNKQGFFLGSRPGFSAKQGTHFKNYAKTKEKLRELDDYINKNRNQRSTTL